MEEWKNIVEAKLIKYTLLFNIAKKLEQKDNIKFDAKCIDKLNKILKRLWTKPSN